MSRPERQKKHADKVMIDDAVICEMIKELARVRGWSDSYAARMATGSGEVFNRIETGGSVTLRRANFIVEKIYALWPKRKEGGEAWPRNFPLPKAEAEALQGDAA